MARFQTGQANPRSKPKPQIKAAVNKPTIYRLPNLVYNTVTHSYNCPSVKTVPPEDDIWVDTDTGLPCPPTQANKTLKRISYITGTRMQKVKGENVPVDIKGEVVFEQGQRIVQVHEVALKEYMDTCNYNGSNPNRRPDRPILFEMVDHTKAKTEKAAKARVLDTAIAELNRMWEEENEETREYALALHIDIDQEPDAIYADLRGACEADPVSFIKNSKSELRKFQVVVRKADRYNLIRYQAGLNKWIWTSDNREFCSVPPGKDGFIFLIEWLIRNPQNNVFDLLENMVREKEAAE